MSYLYFKKDIIKQIGVKGFISVLEKLYKKLVLF